MRKSILNSLVVTTLILAGSSARAATDLEGLLKRVDAIRNPAESYRMKVEVTSSENSENKGEHYIYDVSCGGNDKTLVKTLAPPSSQGKKLLMLHENMWAYVPNLSRPVRISLSQKLNGQTANGDISRMHWSGDYSPSLEEETPAGWRLLLTANKDGLTYAKIRAWIDRKTYRPLKAEFLSVSGKPFKTATYQAYKTLAGLARPSEIVIADVVNANDRSTIRIMEMEVRTFPASVFNQNSLN
jgi:outer membrane lipoprotein-sorting protein